MIFVIGLSTISQPTDRNILTCQWHIDIFIYKIKRVITSLCSASCIRWQHDTARIYCWMPCCCDVGNCPDRSTSPANLAHSSKPAAAACNRHRTVTQTLPHTTWVVSIIHAMPHLQYMSAFYLWTSMSESTYSVLVKKECMPIINVHCESKSIIDAHYQQQHLVMGVKLCHI